MSFQGTNYGTIKQDEKRITLLSQYNGKKILSIDYKNITNTSMSKQDIIIETGAEVNQEDCLCEIRFHVQQPKEEKFVEKEDERDEESGIRENTVSFLYHHIVKNAKIGEFAGESIATLVDMNLVVPRGKYTVDLYEQYLRFHGLTFNHHIDYKNITRGFILPMSNELQVSIVIQLHKNKPIHQGQTIYNYIVIQSKKDILDQIKPKISPEMLEKNPKLTEVKKDYSGPQFQIFAEILFAISKINLISPGNYYKSSEGHPCVKANIKAQPGWLYFLKASLIFINKPVLYIRTQEIDNAEFIRVGLSNKQFDMKITFKEDKKIVQFMGIERNDLDSIVEYLKQRKVKVFIEKFEKNEEIADDGEDESQDEDFEAGQASEDDEDSSQVGELGSEQQSQQEKEKEKKSKKIKGQKASKAEAKRQKNEEE